MRHGAKDDQPISVLGRVCAILDAFGPDDTALPLPALRARTGLPKATVHRLAHELAGHGLLEATPNGFRLGPRLHTMGSLADPHVRLREVAMPHLEDLYDATRMTVQLGVLDRSQVLVACRLTGRGDLAVPVTVGAHLPVMGTALGAALVAFASPAVRAGLLDADLVDGDLARLQASVRESGVAVQRSEDTGLVCIACPVVAETGGSPVAVGVVGPSALVDVDAVVPAVKVAALGLGRSLSGGVRAGVADLAGVR